MFARCFVVAAVVVCATGATAQTHGQRLESAVFAEDTAGDVNAAIRIYEQLTTAPGVPAQVAARARSRLLAARRLQVQQSSAQRGLPGQVDPPSTPPPAPPAAAVPVAPSDKPATFSDMYDAKRPLTVVGRVTDVQWMDPHVVVFVRSNIDGKDYGFALGPPSGLIRLGWKQDSLKTGELILAEGHFAKGSAECPTPLEKVPSCAVFPNGARHANGRVVMKFDADGNLARPGTQPASQRGPQ